MKPLFTLFILIITNSLLSAQNINYESRITSFFGSSSCGNDPGNASLEEHTWHGYISDDVNTAETSSGCIQCDRNGDCARTGSYAIRNQYNVTATQIRTRIDAWEDDAGARCDFDVSGNGDDCRANQTCVYNFTNPLEYQWTNFDQTCGTSDYNMNTFYRYRYATVALSDAVENSELYTTGGNRPFWGSRGNWSNVGNDCATSGTISDNQTSSLMTTVSCKSQITFQWRVSSELGADWLEVYINGVRRDRISGIQGWTTRTINLDFGDNTIEWRYAKNGAISVGEDRGYIDQVAFVNANTINPGSISGNQTICSEGDPSNLASTNPGEIYSNTPIYQWQFSNDNSNWINIGSSNGLSYDPPSGLIQTRYYRRRLQDGCGNTAYSNTVTVTVNPLPNADLLSPPAICPGGSANVVFDAYAGTGPWDIVYNGVSLNNISSGTNINVAPASTTTYSLSSITDDNGCVRTIGFGSNAKVIVNTNSTDPTITPVSGKQCPNTTMTLSANGGTEGTGSNIQWYTGPNGTGSHIGTGNTINIVPTSTTTYYARREGTCNTTNDDSEVVDVKNYIYTPVGVTQSVDYCTDNNGWHHFFDANDDIIFSVSGDLSGATSTPTIAINNNGSYYQTTVGAVGSCANGWTPGEEFFELPRSWNVEFSGTLNPPYEVRYYFPLNEKTDVENAAINHMATNSDCNYTYKYSYPNGFYWFKNIGSTYNAPQFDEPTKLSGNNGSINGINYSQITGITSFSGGSGAVALTPDPGLPVELTTFKGWNEKTSNVLQWMTETELNNDRFEIERSINPQEGFVKIATVDGAGTSNQTLSYLFEDQNPMLGVNYYRLRQIDFDGTYTYSNIIAIEVEGTKGKQMFFPNPTSAIVNYQLDASQEEMLSITIMDILGKTLYQTNYQITLGINTTSIDLSDYTSGTYIVKIQNNQGKVIATEKIVKHVE